MPEFTLNDLAQRFNLTLAGAGTQAKDAASPSSADGSIAIQGVGSLAHAQAGQISHLSSHRYLDLLDGCNASALLIRAEDRHRWPGPALVCSNPYLAYAQVTQLFSRIPSLAPGQHPSAVIDPSCEVHPTARIGPGVVLGANCVVAADAAIYANASLGDDCRVGEASRIMPSAVLYADVHIGARCVVHSGAILGADGFGYTPNELGHMVEIAQLGGVRIGDDVSIGAATTIDRGALDNTEISEGVKIDNQVQIGHNSYIGAHSLICGCVGIVGSSRIGKHCVLAGGVGVGGDGPVEICDGVILTATTLVTQSITQPGVYSGGVLHAPASKWKRNAIRFQNLDALARRVSKLEKRTP